MFDFSDFHRSQRSAPRAVPPFCSLHLTFVGMKFGKDLQINIIDKWKDFYINYDALKEILETELGKEEKKVGTRAAWFQKRATV